MVLLVLNEKQKEKISLLNKFDETSKKNYNSKGRKPDPFLKSFLFSSPFILKNGSFTYVKVSFLIRRSHKRMRIEWPKYSGAFEFKIMKINYLKLTLVIKEFCRISFESMLKEITSKALNAAARNFKKKSYNL